MFAWHRHPQVYAGDQDNMLVLFLMIEQARGPESFWCVMLSRIFLRLFAQFERLLFVGFLTCSNSQKTLKMSKTGR